MTTLNWNETLRFMREIHNADDVKITLVENFLHRMTSEQKSSCMCCGAELQTMFLLPCACQICTECMNPQIENCLSCGEKFDIDDFQRLQPGLDYRWKWNIIEAQEERERRRMTAESLRSGVGVGTPVHNNIPNQINEDTNNVENMPLELRRFARRRNEPHLCVYPEIYRDGKCKFCSEIHPCNFMIQKNCDICHATAEDCPKDESKAFYITNKLLELYSTYKSRGVDVLTGNQKRPLKVIIFTQFQEVSNLVGDRLIRRFGTGCVSEYWGSTKSSELERFTNVRDCFCMLLNKDGSHGLNLSFVTHIFFLDEIFDKSLESQVVARAYRMGATEEVFVEQLVSRHSIEELIVIMNKRNETKNSLYANCDKLDDFTSEYYENNLQLLKGISNSNLDSKDTHAKVKFLLSNVKLIRSNMEKPSSLLLKRKIRNKGSHGEKRIKSVKFNL